MNRKLLPVGFENFRQIRNENFYYIDKTAIIRDLLQNRSLVTLFTRPRRFGKTLTMDMLKTFFEIGGSKSEFDGLEITKETELCEQYMGKFPVISISLKSAAANDYETACGLMGSIITEEARRLQWLMDSDRLTKYDKIPLEKMLMGEIGKSKDLYHSLKVLSELLYKHYGRKVIMLIDEYDVPLEKAWNFHYYDEMVTLVRVIFEQALKTNENLYLAVLTGCMCISKGSIFTGLNNFRVHTISDPLYGEYFGFTDQEVRKLLADYGMEDSYQEVKEWYDGYRFGNAEVYCPWDVLCYMADHLVDKDISAKAYWANSSGNAIVRSLMEQSTATVRAQIEDLISGGSIEIEIAQEMTYGDLGTADALTQIRYLWTILYMTGYLTDLEPTDTEVHKLIIPNKELQKIFEQQIRSWFLETARKDTGRLQAFCKAVKTGDAKTVQNRLNAWLQETISIRDTTVRDAQKENFYHGILLGLLGSESTWIVRSNVESGNGYSDILIEIPKEQTGCVLEIKYAEQGNFDAACASAMNQIEEKQYYQRLEQDGMKKIYLYAIACWRKESRVKCKLRVQSEERAVYT